MPSAASSLTSGWSPSRAAGQVGLRQVGRGPAQDLVLLFQELDPPTRFAQLGVVVGAGPGPSAGIDVGLAHPLRQGHDVDAEVGGDLLQGHAGVAALGDADDVCMGTV